jgi:hypothetical protein
VRSGGHLDDLRTIFRFGAKNKKIGFVSSTFLVSGSTSLPASSLGDVDSDLASPTGSRGKRRVSMLARRAATQVRHRKAEAMPAGDDDVPILRRDEGAESLPSVGMK